MKINFPSQFSCYIAHGPYFNELEKELVLKNHKILTNFSNLILVDSPICDQSIVWSLNNWSFSQIHRFSSINSASKFLNSQALIWSHYSSFFHRRGSLISQKLRTSKLAKPIQFSLETKKIISASYSLLDSERLIYSINCTNIFPNGEAKFIETMEPPSRAYLKLWELFIRIQKFPKQNEKCLDIAASPGGWTWVLQTIGAYVVAIDKSEVFIDKSNGEYIKKDIFKLEPRDFLGFDWMFCDVICYPEKLYEYIKKWVDSDIIKNIVCTIKFQGETNFDIIKKFAEIPDSKIIHLFHNKHEITWYRIVEI